MDKTVDVRVEGWQRQDSLVDGLVYVQNTDGTTVLVISHKRNNEKRVIVNYRSGGDPYFNNAQYNGTLFDDVIDINDDDVPKLVENLLPAVSKASDLVDSAMIMNFDLIANSALNARATLLRLSDMPKATVKKGFDLLDEAKSTIYCAIDSALDNRIVDMYIGWERQKSDDDVIIYTQTSDGTTVVIFLGQDDKKHIVVHYRSGGDPAKESSVYNGVIFEGFVYIDDIDKLLEALLPAVSEASALVDEAMSIGSFHDNLYETINTRAFILGIVDETPSTQEGFKLIRKSKEVIKKALRSVAVIVTDGVLSK